MAKAKTTGLNWGFHVRFFLTDSCDVSLVELVLSVFAPFLIFFLIFYLFMKDRDTERDRERGRDMGEGDAGSL